MKNINVIIFTVLLSQFQILSQESSFTADSTQISLLFTTALSNPSLKDSCFSELKKIDNSIQPGFNPTRDIFNYNKTRFQILTGQLDSARNLAHSSLKNFDSDTLYERVKYLNILASSHVLQKEYQEGIRLFKEALEIAENNPNELQIAFINNNIANIYFSLMDYESSYKYAERAFSIIKNYPDNNYYAPILSILSVAETKLGYNKKANIHAQEALDIAKEKNDILSLIIANYALGEIAIGKNQFRNSEKWFISSIELSEKYGQHHYTLLNSVGLLNAYIGIEEYKKAIEYGTKALQLSEEQNNGNIEYSLKRKIAQAYYSSGDTEKAYLFLNEAHNIYKKTTNADIQASINDLLIKYDSEKKEKEIAKNKILLLENEVKSSRFRQIIFLLLLIVLTLILIFYYTKSKSKEKVKELESKMEKGTLYALIEGEEKERARMAIELHDGLASHLTSIKYQLESIPGFKNERIINIITEAQTDTRRIAHNLSPIKLSDFGLVKALKQFISENSNSNCTISFNDFTEQKEASKNTELLIYRITQELIQNALKHSKASNIDIELTFSDKEYKWSIEDNGIGFNSDEINFGEGLRSIKRRLNRLNGNMRIESNEKGTYIQLAIPLFNL